ncbi:STAS domain-containing protein [Actinomadura hibisca]|uniref:STAS domain-containing protein n=1 Tax=Actinomadura hibisca TaxID=68565 RepID=UPI00083629A5|nr:STAS domain-containing protein [Actinomadura hibisca]
MDDTDEALPLTVMLAVERGCVVLLLSGDLDRRTESQLRRWADRVAVLSGPLRVAVDLTNVRDCDAYGRAALRYTVERIGAAEGRIVLAAAPEGCREDVGLPVDPGMTLARALDLLTERPA